MVLRPLLACVLVLASGKGTDAKLLEPYPSRPVRILVMTPPGGTADMMGRLIAGKLPDKIGGTFIVENRPGAAGSVATTAAAKSAPDGHTLLFSAINALSILPNLMKAMPYDPVKDLAPISLISTLRTCCSQIRAFPRRRFRSSSTLLKSEPGKYDYG